MFEQKKRKAKGKLIDEVSEEDDEHIPLYLDPPDDGTCCIDELPAETLLHIFSFIPTGPHAPSPPRPLPHTAAFVSFLTPRLYVHRCNGAGHVRLSYVVGHFERQPLVEAAGTATTNCSLPSTLHTHMLTPRVVGCGVL